MKKQQQHLHLHRGTTLVEIILYFAVLAVFLFAAISFSLQILNVRTLSSNLHDVRSDLTMIQNTITRTVQSALAIEANGSIFDMSPGALSLTVSEPMETPTLFNWDNGSIFMEQGAGRPIALNSAATYVSQFLVHRIQQTNAPDILLIDITIHARGADITRLEAEKSIHLTIALRHDS